MTSYTPPPTRMELIRIKQKILLFERVHHILKLKLEGLIIEAQKQVRVLAGERKALALRYLESQDILVEAIMIEGEHELSLAAYAVEGEPQFSVTTENLLGVHLPWIAGKDVHKNAVRRGYGILGTTSLVDQTSGAFEQLLDEVIRTAGTESRVKLLLREIDRTRLVVNSLEYRLIPSLYDARHRGELFRDELEREEYTRLFRIKKIKQASDCQEGGR
ncbi:V/A-type H+-transporting ATPase subunit D [Methanolinea mesophila]|uniref:V-type ATP synthase subunit D n=1 Tax=Methanolinea mesophila TaxID=547055 RepID=UPI001AE8421D|nr:V-type ATP synthase subunit D [Methanolinea mesophila]MBP1929932.1 V/A-type H+-transporting ATPase subunit D [Methanolinea mesophila]